MTRSVAEVLNAALLLPDEGRAEVAARLLDSLDAVQDDDAAVMWESEVRQRIRELDRGEVETMSWPEARKVIIGEHDGPPSS